MSVDLQGVPAVRSRYVCANTSAISTLIEGSEVVVWNESGQMKPGVEESRLPCPVGPQEDRGTVRGPRQNHVTALGRDAAG
jgi:hypothetical protein